MFAIAPRWNLLENRIVWICVAAWFIAQVIKVIINSTQDKRVQWQFITDSGGMPSAHSALVSALTTAVGILEGVNSALFAICGVLAIIVIHDAAGVRRTVGMQSSILNRMLDELFKGNPIIKERLRELIGHSRMEIVAGIALGILIGWAGTAIGQP